MSSISKGGRTELVNWSLESGNSKTGWGKMKALFCVQECVCLTLFPFRSFLMMFPWLELTWWVLDSKLTLLIFCCLICFWIENSWKRKVNEAHAGSGKSVLAWVTRTLYSTLLAAKVVAVDLSLSTLSNGHLKREMSQSHIYTSAIRKARSKPSPMF